MYKFLFLFKIYFISNISLAQVQFEKVLELPYTSLPGKIRIENSGIYAISSFSVTEGRVILNDFDSPTRYIFQNNKLLLKESSKDSKINQKANRIVPVHLDSERNLNSENGTASNQQNELISVKVIPSLLTVSVNLINFKKEITFQFPNNLCYADIIGIDKNGNLFAIVETYNSSSSLNITRTVYCFDKFGNLLSKIIIPSIKYLSTVNDFTIDEDGNLYYLLSEKLKLTVFKLFGLQKKHLDPISFPKEYQYQLHFNKFLPIDESPSAESVKLNELASSRSEALHLAESYVTFQYSCKDSNLAPIEVIAPDGDVVKTPPWLIVGANARMAYKWGGFNTVTEFTNGLIARKFSGDIHTSGVSSYAVGVDCSGFVSRCWKLSYHASTSYMPSITTQYSRWEDLRPGDAIHKVGHVRMLIEHTANGALRVVESSARDWSVSYWTYTPSDLSDYTPRYYNQMENNFFAARTELRSVIQNANGKIDLKWTSGQNGRKGFRLYKSNGINNWTLLKNEAELTDTFTTINSTSITEFYRVTPVTNDSLGNVEGLWSNVLGINSLNNTRKILFVDGFERESGSWRGAGHSFSIKYGLSLANQKFNFESIKMKTLNLGVVQMNNYDAVIMMFGDESTVDETFDTTTQRLVKTYLETGGKLFLSGSEIGYDLFYKGTAADKEFYTNYLKAIYVLDNAGSTTITGTSGLIFSGLRFVIGQTYSEDYPDGIDTTGGSKICLNYLNGRNAGIIYEGKFGTSNNVGKLCYLSFPLESTANDTAFESVLNKSLNYFFNIYSNAKETEIINKYFTLHQNFPNPFNSGTVINYNLSHSDFVTLKLFDLLGKEVKTFVSEFKTAGSYHLKISSLDLPTGIYIYKLQSGRNIEFRKMMFLK